MPISEESLRRHAEHLGGQQMLDPETLETLIQLGGEDDPELLIELIDLFLEDSVGRLDVMRESLESGDITQVSREAHALKSASANIGALPFSDRCRELESSAGQSAEEEVVPLVSAALGMFAELSEELGRLKATLV